MQPPNTAAVAPSRGERVNQVFDKYPAADSFPVGGYDIVYYIYNMTRYLYTDITV